MYQMTSSQAQVIDPVLTEHARGYTNQELIGNILLPFVDIPNRSAKVIRFGKDAFRRYMNTQRSPGSQTRRVQYGYESDTVSLHQEALEAQVPYELQQSANKVPGIDLAKGSIQYVQDILALNREVRIAKLVRDPAIYNAANKTTLTGNDKWSAAASKPEDDIKEAREAIRRMIGRYPNVLVLSANAFNALSRHPAIKENFKYTSSDSITEVMLAKYFNIDKIVVGKAVALEENARDSDPASDVWGNDAIIAYVPNGSSFMVPSFGYTYRLSGYPIVESPYDERSTKSWVYPVTEEYRSYVTGAEAGFLFQQVA